MSPFFCTKDESLDWTEITKSGTRFLCLALNEHHLLTCYIILVNLTFLSSFWFIFLVLSGTNLCNFGPI